MILVLPFFPARACPLLPFTAEDCPLPYSFTCPRLAGLPSKVTHYLPVVKSND